MKRFTAIMLVLLVLTAMIIPTVTADDDSVKRLVVIIGTKDELPEPTELSPDFIFVKNESVIYVKYVDPNTGEISYVPEPDAGFDYVAYPEQTWWKGTKDAGLTFTFTAPFEKFVAVYVDGAFVEPENYVASEGSTIIALTPEYLETLEVGDYVITIMASDGVGSVPFHVKDKEKTEPVTPQTGDSSNTGMWAAIALITLGAIGIVALTLVKTRKKTEK
jgi:hypothetical protein